MSSNIPHGESVAAVLGTLGLTYDESKWSHGYTADIYIMIISSECPNIALDTEIAQYITISYISWHFWQIRQLLFKLIFKVCLQRFIMLLSYVILLCLYPFLAHCPPYSISFFQMVFFLFLVTLCFSLPMICIPFTFYFWLCFRSLPFFLIILIYFHDLQTHTQYNTNIHTNTLKFKFCMWEVNAVFFFLIQLISLD